MALSTADAFDSVCRLDRNDTFDDVPQDKKQKIATRLLLDKIHKQDFAGPLSCRASRVLGPISHRVADILPHMKLVSRVSRPGLTVGVLRILCNGLCTAQRFHTSVPGCATSLSLSGDMLRYCYKEIIYYTT